MVFDGLGNATCHIVVSPHYTVIKHVSKLVTYIYAWAMYSIKHTFFRAWCHLQSLGPEEMSLT